MTVGDRAQFACKLLQLLRGSYGGVTVIWKDHCYTEVADCRIHTKPNLKLAVEPGEDVEVVAYGVVERL